MLFERCGYESFFYSCILQNALQLIRFLLNIDMVKWFCLSQIAIIVKEIAWGRTVSINWKEKKIFFNQKSCGLLIFVLHCLNWINVLLQIFLALQYSRINKKNGWLQNNPLNCLWENAKTFLLLLLLSLSKISQQWVVISL